MPKEPFFDISPEVGQEVYGRIASSTSNDQLLTYLTEIEDGMATNPDLRGYLQQMAEAMRDAHGPEFSSGFLRAVM